MNTRRLVVAGLLAGAGLALGLWAADGEGLPLGEEEIFLFRPAGVEVSFSTLAFRGAGGDFARRSGAWHHESSGTRFDPERGIFVDESGMSARVTRLEGFDTYWHMWSLTHPDTEVLEPTAR